MKVSDLVFANGAIAIIVEVNNTSPIGDLEHEDYVRLYYFGSGRFSNSYKWGIVPI
jgi:hypothetical protein